MPTEVKRGVPCDAQHGQHGDDGQNKVVPPHGAELGEEQKVENMRNGEKANPCHAGDRMGSASRAMTVIGDTNGDITKGGQTKRNE